MHPVNGTAPILVRPKDLAIQLSVGRSTLWRWVKRGVLPPPIRIGGIAGWRYKDIEELVESARSSSKP